MRAMLINMTMDDSCGLDVLFSLLNCSYLFISVAQRTVVLCVKRMADMKKSNLFSAHPFADRKSGEVFDSIKHFWSLTTK